jgi:hypothetical protein
MQVPKTLHRFYEQFPGDEACLEALRRMRWPRGFDCTRRASPGRGAPNKTTPVAAVEQRERSVGSLRLDIVPNVSKGELFRFVLQRVTHDAPLLYGQLTAEVVG